MTLGVNIPIAVGLWGLMGAGIAALHRGWTTVYKRPGAN